MTEIHLKQPRFIYSARGSFTKIEEKIQKFREKRDSRYIYENTLNKNCFQHGMDYGDLINLTGRTVSDKIVRDI